MRCLGCGVLAFSLLGAACGDSSPEGGGPQGGGGGNNGGAEAGGEGEGGSGGAPDLVPLTVELLDVANRGPLPNAPCALVKPGGTRAEGTTDADGKVTFDDLDWALGVASVVCVPESAFGYLSFTSADAQDGVLTLHGALTAVAPTAVSITGTAQNPTASGSIYLVQATAGLGNYQATNSSFEIPVESGVPFDLFGLEFKVANNPEPHGVGQDFLAWTAVSNAGVTADTTIDLDFSDTVVPVQASGTVGLPTDAGSPFMAANAYGYLYVTPIAQYFEVLLGFPTRSSYTPDGRLAFEAESIGSLYNDDEVVTVFFAASGTTQNAALSYLVLEGYPTDGDSPDSFLDPPTVIAPKDTVPLEGAAISWDPAGVAATALYAGDNAGNYVYFNWPSNVSSVTLPAMPTGASPFSGSGLLTGDLRREEGSVAEGALYQRVSVSSPLRFTQ